MSGGVLRIVLIAAAALIAAVLIMDLSVVFSSAEHILSADASVPEADCILVLGAFGCVSKPYIEPEATVQPQVDTIEIVGTGDVVPVVAQATSQPAAVPSATPAPTAAPTETPAATAQTPRYVAKDGVYTIAWMSDPQHYSKKFPEFYYSMTEFLRDHREELNLQYVINTGDLVHNTDLDSEWQVATLAQSYIASPPLS